MANAVGWGLLVLGLAAAAYGLAALFSDTVPAVAGPTTGAASLAVGALSVVAGIVLVTRTPRPAPPPAPAAPPPAPETVEIKRTEMEFAPRPADTEGVDDQLEDVRRRMAQLKVRYGLGEIGGRAYENLMADLEAEEVRLEKQKLA